MFISNSLDPHNNPENGRTGIIILFGHTRKLDINISQSMFHRTVIQCDTYCQRKKKGKRKVWGPSFDTEISFKTMGYTNLKKDSLLQVFSEAFVCYCKSWLSKRIQNFQTLTMKSYPHTPTPLWHPTLQSGSRNTLFGNAGLRPGVISLRNTANRCQDYN